MKKYINGFVLLLFLGIANIGYTQATYKIQGTNGIDMKLNGTSTLHDWEMKTKSATGDAQFIFNSENESELTSVKSLMFTLDVKDLQSDNKGLDKNAYKALKADEYESINYKLSSSTMSLEKGGYLLKTKGKLTIAGNTKDILMDIQIILNENGTITCIGAYNLNMTDYNVEPPTFMLGLMKTGDAISLGFEVIYILQNEG